ncbi:domain of Kin17 curved DNA-binding protein-domain-containing protein [Lasiosphaeria miniovina]|uniref:Domain of Kin17 curved DNA-binding protein-domain-containing protein n=1 Tax=Lasiosphaeria miniovina TaxID=1954250 RepID=A0AA40B453_9PEZI|nr:domain of Kin17 curved DNA-binding protein-domain-containing protein [Lasiosphaeria miniovina]KAK0727363.1 domain of Kin17 curved DNA-binding protein-domain-containing protein [Lasiosphaeria miniovina]
MPKAEFGSTKYVSNQMKSRGLNRLRWYCQLCARSLRDENAFKMHNSSESHMRKALEAGQNYKAVEEGFSKEFLQSFLALLKTSHGEGRSVHINKFYNEFIAHKDHVHMNATKWSSLTAFAKYLSREGLVRVEEKEEEGAQPGFYISWIDDSPEAMRRREEVRRKELQDKGDEEREQALLRSQISRAKKDAEARGVDLEESETAGHELKRQVGEKIKLSFGAAKLKSATGDAPNPPPAPDPTPASTVADGAALKVVPESTNEEEGKAEDEKPTEEVTADGTAPALKPAPMKFGIKPQPKNVFKNAFSRAKKKVMATPPKKMSEAERIMKEEIEKKRVREATGGPPNKKMRF